MEIELISEQQIISCLLIFSRVGTTLLSLPGSSYVPIRIKLLLTVCLSVIIFPLVQKHFSELDNSIMVLTYFGREVCVGFFIGTVVNILFSGIKIAANVISAQVGLSSIIGVDQDSGEQDVILSRFLGLLTITSLVITDHHYLLISALISSYELFQWPLVAGPSATGGFITDFIVSIFQVAEQSLIIAAKISAVFIVTGTISYAVICILGRLVPQIQFFFVMMPLQIWLGLLLIALTIYHVMDFYLYTSNGIIEAFEALTKPY